MNKILSLFFLSAVVFSCAKQSPKVEPAQTPSAIKPKITFVELGSTSCIPCKEMQEVMKKVESKYGSQINVIFHDINKEKDVAVKFKVEMIPTQVFLDSNGVEFYRHVGFYPEKNIDSLLNSKGLTIKQP